MANESVEHQPEFPFEDQLRNHKAEYIRIIHHRSRTGLHLDIGQRMGFVEDLQLQVGRDTLSQQADLILDEMAELIVTDLKGIETDPERVASLSSTRAFLRGGKTPSSSFGQEEMDGLTDKMILRLISQSQEPSA